MARRQVATMRMHWAKIKTYFGLILFDSEPLKLVAKARTPIGILRGSSEYRAIQRETGIYIRSATEMTDQWYTSCHSAVMMVKMVVHQR